MRCIREIYETLNILFILYYLLHMKMKKMLVGAFLGMFAVAGTAMVLPSYTEAGWTTSDLKATPNKISDDTLKGDNLLDTISNAINWLLAMLATIAVVICLYAGFLMVTSAWDEKKYEKWLTILKYAAVGIAIVWLSWLIVSVVFWLLKQNAQQGDMANGKAA